jgi:hypothetical protein
MEVKYKSLDAKISKLAHTQIQKPDNQTEFYPRVVNQTNIIFTNKEMTLLNKGLKYNVKHKGKHWLSNLALEAEAAVMRLPAQEQEPVRHMVAHNLQKLYKQFNRKRPPNDRSTRNEIKIVNQIRRKLEDSHAIVTKADKGNSKIILYEYEYNRKIHTFIAKNSFTQSTQDITNKLQQNVRSAINECNTVIPKDQKWKYINLNRSTPTIRGLIKIHKEEAPIRPIINWKNAPGYKLAKRLTNTLQTYIHLPYTFNIKNTSHLIDDLNNIP